MAFHRAKPGKKNLWFPSLMDVIFMVVIFSILNIQISPMVNEEPGEGRENVPDLPLIAESQIDAADTLQTIMFYINYNDTLPVHGPKRISVLKPEIGRTRTIRQALDLAFLDTVRLSKLLPMDMGSLGRMEFERTGACRMIRDQIHEYKNSQLLSLDPKNPHAVEISAVQGTEYRIIDYIMRQCAVYGDTIPLCIFRTL
jgi:hypothetical protein